MTEQTPTESSRSRKATKIGIVTSNKMDKSVVVRVDRTVKHPKYMRYVRKRKQFMAHDETNQCHIGDTVEIRETRPLSSRKRWRVSRIVRRAAGATETTAPESASAKG